MADPLAIVLDTTSPAPADRAEKTRSIGVCIASHNRREITLECLRRLFGADLPPSVSLSVYLVDDGSTDGTADAVADEFPSVSILRGSGDLFWGGGMRTALSAAMAAGHDFYLWLNDDIELFDDSLVRAIETHDSMAAEGKEVIIVGATRDESGATTYSGMVRAWPNPIGFRHVEPDPYKPVECEASNGNFVLIPRAAAEAVENIDSRFTHRMGDIDYILRAADKGYSCWLCPGYVATCEKNLISADWLSRRHSLKKRWQLATSPLGLPPRQWIAFGYRHGGVLGFAVALRHYTRVLFPRKAKGSPRLAK